MSFNLHCANNFYCGLTLMHFNELQKKIATIKKFVINRSKATVKNQVLNYHCIGTNDSRNHLCNHRTIWTCVDQITPCSRVIASESHYAIQINFRCFHILYVISIPKCIPMDPNFSYSITLNMHLYIATQKCLPIWTKKKNTPP